MGALILTACITVTWPVFLISLVTGWRGLSIAFKAVMLTIFVGWTACGAGLWYGIYLALSSPMSCTKYVVV